MRFKQPFQLKKFFSLILSCVLWLSAIGVGQWILLNYENKPGKATSPSLQWPSDSQIQHGSNRNTLIMFVHPHCSCSRASLEELNQIMARCPGKVDTNVIFVKPPGVTDDWLKTDLWKQAARIPGVKIGVDKEGVEALKFHALTSGHTVLYNAQGRLLFSGGITGSRGHAGDNAGQDSVISLILRSTVQREKTSVFGCSLLSSRVERPILK